MKKRLLFAALALMSAATSFAFEVGDYVFTATQRLKITGDNQVVNGGFDGLETGWTNADGEAVDAETWAVEPGVGPNGENAVKSLGATEGKALCQLLSLAPGTYVVSYQIKGPGEGTTTFAYEEWKNGSPNRVLTYANMADVFINTTGTLTRELSTDEATVTTVASKQGYTDQWTTVNYACTIEEGQFLVFHFERIASDVMITNVTVQPADEVYDIRIIQRKIAYARRLMADPNFDTPAAADAKAYLEDVIATFEDAIQADALDDISIAESMVESFAEPYNDFLDASSASIATEANFKYITDLTAFPKYNRGQITEGQVIGGFKFNGGNWLHGSGATYLNKQIQGTYDNGGGTVSLVNNKIPAGKYYVAADVRNAYCDKDYNYTYNAENQVTPFIGANQGEAVTIKGDEWTRIYFVAEYDGEDFNAGFTWDGENTHTGTTFQITNFDIRSMSSAEDIEAQIIHKEAFENFLTQYNAAVDRRNTILSMQGDLQNYPWSQALLQEALDTFDPFLNPVHSWVSDGKDTGVATTDELNEWANYQGGEVPEDGKATYYVVRGYTAAINAVKAANQSIADLKATLADADAQLNDAMNGLGDKATFKAAIAAAQKTLDDVLASTNDEAKDADEAKLTEANETLKAAIDAFLESAVLTPIVDIDFSNGFVDNVIQGAAGQMEFDNVNTEDNTADDNAFKLGYGEDYLDVLRVGGGSGIVTFDAPTDEEVIRCQFDLWVGNLTNNGKPGTQVLGVQLKNEGDERVAGFSFTRYNAYIEYNDFNNEANEGMDINGYVTAIGSSSAANAAICVDNNKSSFDLILDYKNKVIKGIVVNGKNGRCEGIELPMPEVSDNKAVKFELFSNYTVSGRLSWFDNLKIYKYPGVGNSSAIIGDVTGDGIVNALDIQTIINACVDSSTDSKFDLTNDGIVNALDIQTVINIAAAAARRQALID
jgi:hypothetical protein